MMRVVWASSNFRCFHNNCGYWELQAKTELWNISIDLQALCGCATNASSIKIDK